ncbi:hypothetical protein HAX54_004752 [Datura stramonium]|uniref:Uncharacterized protein n=1 Tax=Datura stramonium TaxID=4076 RepID=A0ABS8T7F5_DATST|nr:hypothetical protein [Datura stramonium]
MGIGRNSLVNLDINFGELPVDRSTIQLGSDDIHSGTSIGVYKPHQIWMTHEIQAIWMAELPTMRVKAKLTKDGESATIVGILNWQCQSVQMDKPLLDSNQKHTSATDLELSLQQVQHRVIEQREVANSLASGQVQQCGSKQVWVLNENVSQRLSSEQVQLLRSNQVHNDVSQGSADTLVQNERMVQHLSTDHIQTDSVLQIQGSSFGDVQHGMNEKSQTKFGQLIRSLWLNLLILVLICPKFKLLVWLTGPEFRFEACCL